MKHGLVYKKLSYCRDSARRIHDGAFGEMTEIIIYAVHKRSATSQR